MIEISAIEPAADIQSSVQDIKGVCERLGRIFVPTERVVYFLANQERTRKHRKILYIKIVVFLSVLCIVMLLFLLFKKGKKYPFTYSENSQYMPIADGEMLELTGDGGVFRYSNTGKKILLLEASDIQYLSVLYEREMMYTLAIHKDGTLALGIGLTFQEKKIGNLESAIKAKLQLNSIVLLTEGGELYEGTITGTWSNFYESATGDVKFVRIEGITEIDDISVTARTSTCLTRKGEVWAKGEFYDSRYENYTRIVAEMPMQQISNASNTILALDEAGTLYEVGIALDEKSNSDSNKQFTKVLTYGKAVQIYGSGERAILYNEDGTVRFFGHISRGKAAGEPWSSKVRGLKNVRQVFIRGSISTFCVRIVCTYGRSRCQNDSDVWGSPFRSFSDRIIGQKEAEERQKRIKK